MFLTSIYQVPNNFPQNLKYIVEYLFRTENHVDISFETIPPLFRTCDAPKLEVSVDYSLTRGIPVCLVSRDSYLSKNASWPHKPILIKTNITTIFQLSPNNSIVDYTFIQTYIKI